MWTSLLLVLSSLSACSGFALHAPATAHGVVAPMCASTIAVPRVAAAPLLKEKKDVLELEGVVLEALPGANFRVQLDDTEQVILAHVSGKIRKNFIKILVGDHVTCEISPYDLVWLTSHAQFTASHDDLLCVSPQDARGPGAYTRIGARPRAVCSQTKGRITFRKR